MVPTFGLPMPRKEGERSLDRAPAVEGKGGTGVGLHNTTALSPRQRKGKKRKPAPDNPPETRITQCLRKEENLRGSSTAFETKQSVLGEEKRRGKNLSQTKGDQEVFAKTDGERRQIARDKEEGAKSAKSLGLIR